MVSAFFRDFNLWGKQVEACAHNKFLQRSARARLSWKYRVSIKRATKQDELRSARQHKYVEKLVETNFGLSLFW